MGLLTSLGLISLALAGLSGWLVLAVTERPAWFHARGISAPRRFLQVHLDWVMMGLILIAIDIAAPGRPTWITAALALGLMLNPLLFLPLAWGAGPKENVLYKLVVLVSFTATSGGLTALAASQML